MDAEPVTAQVTGWIRLRGRTFCQYVMVAIRSGVQGSSDQADDQTGAAAGRAVNANGPSCILVNTARAGLAPQLQQRGSQRCVPVFDWAHSHTQCVSGPVKRRAHLSSQICENAQGPLDNFPCKEPVRRRLSNHGIQMVSFGILLMQLALLPLAAGPHISDTLSGSGTLHTRVFKWYIKNGHREMKTKGNAAALAVFSSRTAIRRDCGGRSADGGACAPPFTLPIYMDCGCRDTSGSSHIIQICSLVSVWYARVPLPMRSIVCSRCLREVLYTYVLGFLTNNGMPPANIFDVLVRWALTRLTCAGGAQISDDAFSTRLYGKYFAEEHTFLQA